MFGYGFLAIVLVLYLAALGIPDLQIGLILTLTLVGDTVISLWLTTHADRVGRRLVLILGAVLMVGAGAVFAVVRDPLLLLLAATIGVISPSGNEVGPFLAVEQASLTQRLPAQRRTSVLAWYNLAGQLASAVGALAAGLLAQIFLTSGSSPLEAYRAIVIGYALVGILLAAGFLRLTPGIEVPPEVLREAPPSRFGLHKSRRVVLRLSAVFSLDAFAGGFVTQSLLAYWFHLRWGVEPAVLGGIFFAANILAAISALSAARLAARFGLINTMVFTHLPSNVLLILVPLMPNLPLAVLVLLARFSISQMDVPTRQSYTISVVDPDERSAAAGVTGIARTTGSAISPLIAAPLVGMASLAAVPFFVAGGLKIAYDLILYRLFRSAPTPEERGRERHEA
ncbi:MAG: MFS transporter [Chloroflexota bacterium]|nr:MFS transporter [Chloroflexota bacterium]